MSDSSNHQKKASAEAAPAEAAGERFGMLTQSLRQTLIKSRASTNQFRKRTRAAAGPALSNTATALRRGTEKATARLKSFVTNSVRPKLRHTGAWVAGHLNPRTLLVDYRRLLTLIHRWGPDRKVERLCFVPTSKHVPLSIVRVPHRLRETGHDYRPSPKRVFEWAMELIPEPVKRFEFVDYGAGRGRVLLLASHHPFERITGAEIAEELHRDCLLNIAQYPRSLMKCRELDCEHLSALRLDVPASDTVFYLNNPFDRSMLERVVDRVVRSYKQEPRRFYVIAVDIQDDDVFEDTGIFEKVHAPWQLRTKIALFSPYTIQVYRTVH